MPRTEASQQKWLWFDVYACNPPPVVARAEGKDVGGVTLYDKIGAQLGVTLYVNWCHWMLKLSCCSDTFVSFTSEPGCSNTNQSWVAHVTCYKIPE